MQHIHRSLRSFVLLLFFIWNHAGSAQSVPSRMAGRFHFRDLLYVADSSTVNLSIPKWFVHDNGSSLLYFGAVNRYGLSSLTEAEMGGMIRSDGGSVRWEAATVGDVVFRRGLFNVGMVKRLNASVWLGSGMGISFARVAGYGTSWMPIGNVAVGGVAGRRLYWSLRWDNPHSVLNAKSWYRSDPMRIRMGIAGGLSSRVSVFGGMEWERAAATASLLKVTYRLSKYWKADLGWGWSPDQLIIGLHRSFHRGSLGMGFSRDPVLGSSFSFFSVWNHNPHNR